MTATAGRYEPRDPTQRVLLHVVRDHFETFRAQAASLRDGEGLPGFVERESASSSAVAVSPRETGAAAPS